ncbi:MAG: ribonuclease HII [Epulopiscium sp.]|nr:ribonuclease HII [Candidatus Epulonipiscium sp.]HOQ15948.1 ribonuclease HII [Defluviitaleaceae bacterium]HPT76228.1 ribonuclease HII [Defluviitaleaceae bacterium]
MEKFSLQSIEKQLKEVSYDELPNFLEEIKKDSRIGVQKLVQKYERKYETYQVELKRIQEMSQYEKYYYQKGVKYIAGIDEAGRGPLAGPVVAAAVILPKDCFIMGINDSKKLSLIKREELFEIINKKALSIGIGIVDPQTIDRINILQATFEAMKKALDALSLKPELVLVDGNQNIPDISVPQEDIIKGDQKSISVAAAAIVAKVTRDRIMDKFHELYSEYGFNKHKGYGTKEHIEAIKKYGLCPIHRESFTRNLY